MEFHILNSKQEDNFKDIDNIPYRRDINEPLNKTSSRIEQMAAASLEISNSTSNKSQN